MEIQPHHIKPEVCTTRPKYREGKTPKAVKAYTCALESKYLLVVNVPSINVENELIKLLSIYGEIEEHKILFEYPSDEFHEVILVKFAKIQNARTAKIKMDDYNFYGSQLHICYASEYESLDDLREKLNERRFIVELKCNKYESIGFGTKNYKKPNRKEFKKKSKYSKTQTSDKSKSEMNLKNELKVEYPKLPDNWIKPTITGDASYDETAIEISQKLKRTIVRNYLFVYKKEILKKIE